MKVFLSLVSGLLLLTAFVFQANAKGHGPGKGKGKGHGQYKNYKKAKHYCNAHCHGVHHVYPNKVIIVQPAPRPGLNINLAL